MSKFEKVDFNELGKRIKDEISIEMVHESYSGGFVDKKGTMSVCPFCGKHKLYQTPGNTFLCYGCNEESIDIFKYYQLKFNVNFYVAKISLARDFGYIKPETAERLLRGKNNTTYIPQKSSSSFKKPIEKEVVPRQAPEVISNVYNTMGILSPLTREQYYYLKNIRKLSMKRIMADYFNPPYMKGEHGRKFMDALLERLEKSFGYKEEDLIGIPGFYMDESGRMTFCNKKGIAMKARRANKMVNGIQIRNYDYIKKDGDLHINNPEYKYLWVTSRDLKKGIPSGAAIDVIVPDGPMHTTLIITEGKFKSEVICERFRCPVISIQGVYQWKNVLDPEVKYVNEHIRKINNINICFDADMGTNLEVYRELRGMTETVLSKYEANIKMGIWDQRFGKGLDDIIISQNTDKLKKVDFEDYVEKYELFMKALEHKYYIKRYNVYYKDTENKVDKDELMNLYTQYVLIPLGVEIYSN